MQDSRGIELNVADEWAEILLRFREVAGQILGTEKASLDKQLFLKHLPSQTQFLYRPIEFFGL